MKLSQITAPNQLRGCSQAELQEIAGEIRQKILTTVSRNGGHLASNLGVVELTLALHRTLSCPKDKLIFDVGHQCYAHKLLTGRGDRFDSLRRLDGLCGFPVRTESEYDAFGAGHASTALSAAVGMARARDLTGDDYRVAAVVGDGALTGGMCYEALNDAGSRKTAMLLVLNDNGMSISRNVGALSAQLTRLRLSRGWLSVKHAVAETLRKAPLGGKRMYDVFQRIKNSLRNVLVHDRFFTSLGWRYFGPIDGHDIQEMERIFNRLLALKEPVVVHVVTKKGAGYEQAENAPERYHGVSPRAAASGAGMALGAVAGDAVARLAAQDPSVAVITAAMTDSTGFASFAARFPDRLFDVGIAEEHAVTMAAGMAAAGMRPFVAIYETFLQRGVDQMLTDVCLQRLPVCFLMDRAGIGGEDGATHHGLFGASLLRMLPNLTLLSPRCGDELAAMIAWAARQQSPVAIRYGKGGDAAQPAYTASFAPGQWETVAPGQNAALIACATMTDVALRAREALAARGVSLRVIHASSVKPLDEACLRGLSDAGTPWLLLEEGPASGLCGAVLECCQRLRLRRPDGMITLPDAFIPHGARAALLARYGLTAENVADQIERAVAK